MAKERPNKTKLTIKAIAIPSKGRPSPQKETEATGCSFPDWPESKQIEFVADVFSDKLSDEKLCIKYGYSAKSRHMLYRCKETEKFQNLYNKIEKANINRARNRAYRFADALMKRLIDIGLKGHPFDPQMGNVQRQAINDVLAKIGLHGKEGIEVLQDREININWLPYDYGDDGAASDGDDAGGAGDESP